MLDAQKKKAVHLRWEGLKTYEVAAALGVHRATLWRWWQREDMQRYALAYWEKERRKILDQGREDCVRMIDSNDPLEAQRAALRVIDHCFETGLL